MTALVVAAVLVVGGVYLLPGGDGGNDGGGTAVSSDWEWEDGSSDESSDSTDDDGSGDSDGSDTGDSTSGSSSSSTGSDGSTTITLTDYDWDASLAPDYYIVTGTAEDVDFTAEDGITYSSTDSLGRATWAGGWITGEMRAEAKAKDRSTEPDLPDPAGWPDNVKVTIASTRSDVSDYNGYLWNRSHLVAYSLGGDSEVHNLVTGTRCQNVGLSDNSGGMAYTETLARDWLDDNPDGKLWYAATPVYEGDELIPRAVIVDIYTEDGSIDERVVVYNAANGFSIDYATGEVEAE